MPGRGLHDGSAAVYFCISPPSVICPEFCLQSADMKHGATSWVITEVVIEDSDRETLGFDCRLVLWAQEALSALNDRDIK